MDAMADGRANLEAGAQGFGGAAALAAVLEGMAAEGSGAWAGRKGVASSGQGSGSMPGDGAHHHVDEEGRAISHHCLSSVQRTACGMTASGGSVEGPTQEEAGCITATSRQQQQPMQPGSAAGSGTKVTLGWGVLARTAGGPQTSAASKPAAAAATAEATFALLQAQAEDACSGLSNHPIHSVREGRLTDHGSWHSTPQSTREEGQQQQSAARGCSDPGSASRSAAGAASAAAPSTASKQTGPTSFKRPSLFATPQTTVATQTEQPSLQHTGMQTEGLVLAAAAVVSAPPMPPLPTTLLSKVSFACLHVCFNLVSVHVLGSLSRRQRLKTSFYSYLGLQTPAGCAAASAPCKPGTNHQL